MFKKSADLTHLHQRTGSHATKGSARGVVMLRALGADDFHSEESKLLRRQRLRILRWQRSTAIGEFKNVLAMIDEAVERRDTIMIRALRTSLRRLSKNLTAVGVEIDELKNID